MNKGIKWWGYKHVNGGYQAKRYFGHLDIWEARRSPFCEKVVGPFTVPITETDQRQYALDTVKELTS